MQTIGTKELEYGHAKTRGVVQEVRKAILDKDYLILKVLMAVLAKGHILLEDVPGVGKTTLALAFSKAMALSYKRMQFTPDVLPSDVVGFSLFDRQQNTFRYQEGGACCNLFLADEINRTSPKTQAALLEVMEEGSVTVDGQTHELPKPYTVIATQNPVGSIGTQMLPESQLDRFMVRLSMGYPDAENEISILKGRQRENPLTLVNPVVNRADILRMQELVEQVFVQDSIYEYIVALARLSRAHPLIRLGISPRGSIAVMRMAKAAAFLQGRDYVIPDDVELVLPDVCVHRLVLSAKAKAENFPAEQVLQQVMKEQPFSGK